MATIVEMATIIKDPTIIKELGERVRSVREHHSIVQAEFAAVLGVKEYELSRIEDGEKKPSASLLTVLKRHFAVNGEWLMTGEGEMFSEGALSESIENTLQCIRMFKQLSENSKRKLLNILNIFLITEYAKRDEMRKGRGI